MNNQADYLKDITEIRSLMERSSRFISLSGLSGVCAGICALIGAAAAYYYLDLELYSNNPERSFQSDNNLITFFFIDAILVLGASLITAIYFTTRKAKKDGLKIWDATAQRLIINLFLPLVVGGIFCFALLFHGVIGLIAPSTLIFYGIALLNGSKYTFNDIRYLGICEIILGLIASFFIGYGFLFWVLGFGILHILYGTIMYFKYEKK